jgi:hypothetical protein
MRVTHMQLINIFHQALVLSDLSHLTNRSHTQLLHISCSDAASPTTGSIRYNTWSVNDAIFPVDAVVIEGKLDS